MRVRVRSTIDLDKPINLKRLGPVDKIYAGIISQWRSHKFYKSSKRKKEEAAYVEQTKRDETVKSYILAYLYGELSQNNTLKTLGRTTQSIVIEVNQKYEDSLKRLLPNLYDPTKEPGKDFVAFDVERVEENSDIRRAFPDMPILLRATKKVL